MHLIKIVQDSQCRGRIIRYLKNAIQVFYKHELRALADLFGGVPKALFTHPCWGHEFRSLTQVVAVVPITNGEAVIATILPPRQSIRLAYSVSLSTLILAQSIGPALALPTNYRSVAGDVKFSQSGSTLNISTSAQRSIASYRQFNIAQGETVNFHLPNAQAAILNRVTGGDPSSIFGRMNANGQVFLVNPSGILFGSTAQVNVGSLVASTLEIGDQDFLNGNLAFRRTSAPPGPIVNQGEINVASGGFAVLTGGSIHNTGSISAPGGKIALAVGDEITVSLDDGMLVKVTVDQALKDKLDSNDIAILNDGTLSAAGGTVSLQALLADGVYNHSINNQGVVEATGFNDQNGVVEIVASGLVENSGLIDASGTADAANGGQVSIHGSTVVQAGSVLAEGAEGGTGGSIGIVSTDETILANGSTTSAKGAGTNSSSGDIFIWSDGVTSFESGAVLDVSGGSDSGDGGFLEVSAVDTVYFKGQAYGGANNGQAGTILIDPTDIVVENTVTPNPVAGGDSNGSADEAFGEDSGSTVTFDPQSGSTFNGFQNIWLQATNDITINSPFDTTVATGNPSVSLRLEANNNINVNAPLVTHNADLAVIADADNAGGGTLNLNSTIVSNDGDILLSGASISGNSGPITAGLGNITIEATDGSINLPSAEIAGHDIDIRATGDIALHQVNPAITSNGGDMAVIADSDTQNGGSLTFGHLQSNGGDVTLQGSSVVGGAVTTLFPHLLQGDIDIVSTDSDANPINQGIQMQFLVGNNVTLQTTNGGSITLQDGFINSLEASATNNITIQQPFGGSLNVGFFGNPGNVTLTADSDHNDSGDVFASSIRTNGGNVTIEGVNVHLVGQYDLGAGDLTVTAATGSVDMQFAFISSADDVTVFSGGVSDFVTDPLNPVIHSATLGTAFITGDLVIDSASTLELRGMYTVGSMSASAAQDLQAFFTPGITANGGDIRLIADSDRLNGGWLTVGANLSSNGGDIYLQGARTQLNSGLNPAMPAIVDAGTGDITMIGTDTDPNFFPGTIFLATELHGDHVLLKNEQNGSIITEFGKIFANSVTVETNAMANLGEITTQGGNIEINGVADGQPVGGFIRINGPLQTNGGDIILTHRGLEFNNTLDAGSGNIYLESPDVDILVGADPNGFGFLGFPLYLPDLSLFTADTLVIGSLDSFRRASLADNLDLSPFAFNLRLESKSALGLFNGQEITLGNNQSLEIISAEQSILLDGSVSGGVGSTFAATSGMGILTINPITLNADNIHLSALADITLTADIVGTTSVTLEAGKSLSNTKTISGGTISLSALDGDLTLEQSVTATGDLSLFSDGDIQSLDTLTADTLTLSSGGNIYSNSPILIDVENLRVTAAGDAEFIEADDLTLLASNVGGLLQLNTPGNIVVAGDTTADTLSIVSTGGNLTVNATVTGTTSTHLAADGNITGNGMIESTALTMLAHNGSIGQASDALNIDTATLDVNAANGSVYLDEANNIHIAAAVANTVLSLTAGGNIMAPTVLSAQNLQLTSTSGNIGSSGQFITADTDSLQANAMSGSVYVQETDGVILRSSSAQNDFRLISGGGIPIQGPLTAGRARLQAQNGGNIVQRSGQITAGNLHVQSGTGNIRLNNTNVDNLTGSTTGNITVREADGLRIGHGGLTGNNISITAIQGSLATGGTITGNRVNLATPAGSIVDGNGDQTDIISTGSAELRAESVIGRIENPLDVEIQNGTLSVESHTGMNAFSVVIEGTVSPEDTLKLLNTPPWGVLFNGKLLSNMGGKLNTHGIGPISSVLGDTGAPSSTLVTQGSLLNVDGNITNLDDYTSQVFNLFLQADPFEDQQDEETVEEEAEQ